MSTKYEEYLRDCLAYEINRLCRFSCMAVCLAVMAGILWVQPGIWFQVAASIVFCVMVAAIAQARSAWIWMKEAQRQLRWWEAPERNQD